MDCVWGEDDLMSQIHIDKEELSDLYLPKIFNE
jgi:hypothetical protein